MAQKSEAKKKFGLNIIFLKQSRFKQYLLQTTWFMHYLFLNTQVSYWWCAQNTKPQSQKLMLNMTFECNFDLSKQPTNLTQSSAQKLSDQWERSQNVVNIHTKLTSNVPPFNLDSHVELAISSMIHRHRYKQTQNTEKKNSNRQKERVIDTQTNKKKKKLNALLVTADGAG